MDNRLVITIGRQCGSGGRRIGQMLAEQLGIKCYDKEILNRAAKESGELGKPKIVKPKRQRILWERQIRRGQAIITITQVRDGQTQEVMI